MPRFKNISPLGALDVPALGRIVQPDEEFDVSTDVAALLGGQGVNFKPLDAKAKSAAKQASAALAPFANPIAEAAAAAAAQLEAPASDDDTTGEHDDDAA